jgi:hypothetical protein
VEGGEGIRRAGAEIRLPRPAPQEGRLPAALDHAHQRRGPAARALLQPLDERAQEGRVEINRKVLADLAVRDPVAFGELAEVAKQAL